MKLNFKNAQLIAALAICPSVTGANEAQYTNPSSTQIGNSVLIDIGEASGGKYPYNSFIELKTPKPPINSQSEKQIKKLVVEIVPFESIEKLKASIDGQPVPTEKLVISVRDESGRQTHGLSADPLTGQLRLARPGDYLIEVAFKGQSKTITYSSKNQKKEK